MKLDGKVVLITGGAGSGLGRQSSLLFSAEAQRSPSSISMAIVPSKR